MNMKKYALLLAATLLVSAFSACDEETTLPYIPYEEDETETPTEGEDPEAVTNTYCLKQVLQCSPENPNGVDIFGKLDFFATLRMTVSVSATGAVVEFDNGDVPFLPFAEALPEGKIECDLDHNVIPNVLRIRDTETVIATFEKDGFTTEFQLDSKLLSYKYKYTKL
ncbi:hypothetical protein [Alistipes sp.]|uniref:hypothetical protein n=1 Tax=Alistipes sp. TaxID=1872444 RepID=UPI0025BB04E1|nr:hypothetical protein [Alistipes sp.]